MGDTTYYHAMAFAEGDMDNDGRFEPLAADMKPYGSGADIDAAWGPVLPPDAGRLLHGTAGHTPIRSKCGTRPARSATAWPGSASTPPAGTGRLSSELLLTGWPVPRRASPLSVLSRSGRVLEASSSAFARSGRPPAMSGSKPRGPRGPRHTL